MELKNIDKLEKIVFDKLSEKRANHSKRVANKVLEMAKKYDFDEKTINKLVYAGYLHDIAKEESIEELNELVKNKYEEIENNRTNAIMHGFGATEYIKKNKDKFSFIEEYLDDEFYNILNYHTIGKEKMNLLEKLIYLADAIEDGRKYEGVDEIRNIFINKGIDEALILELNLKIKSLIDRNLKIHINTIKFRNELINEREKNL